ncbi:MAG: hypothetical protein ACR2HN_05625 [Tepidiformaceae bacterium]
MRYLKIRHWVVLLPATLALLLAAALVGCGGDDDDDDDTNGGDNNGIPNLGGGTGGDDKFVADVCKAGVAFLNSLNKSISDPAIVQDSEKLTEKIADSFEDFSNEFAKARPPSDMKSWHSDASKELKARVSRLKKGEDLETVFADEGEPFPEPPAAAGERLRAAAEKNKDCQEAQFTFEDE